MEHYVTLFNSLFLPQGLALHMSMERHIKEYTLWILCVDEETYQVLTVLSLSNVRLLQLSKLETEELLRVKKDRTIKEYCWTLTPFTPRFVFDMDPLVKRVTYVDADLWFRKNPMPIFREFDASGKTVMITDHAYEPEFDQSATSGQYCVQFMIFTRDGGDIVRKWWEERCIEWCYAHFENGKLGDQKYLDDWPERFGEQVHVLQAKELALAPWNSMRFPYANSVFYHFHGLRITSELRFNIAIYPLPRALLREVYKPYCTDLRDSIKKLRGIGYEYRAQAKPLRYVRSLYNKLKRAYQLIQTHLPSGSLPPVSG